MPSEGEVMRRGRVLAGDGGACKLVGPPDCAGLCAEDVAIAVDEELGRVIFSRSVGEKIKDG